MPRITAVVCALLCAALVVPSLAAAKPGQRGFNQTYPYASKLCIKAENGKTPKRLAASSGAVVADCATLRTSFTAAQTAYTTTTAPLKQQARDAIAALRATCKQARAAGDLAPCKAARVTTRTTIQGLRSQWKAGGQTYHASVDAARKTFWAAIRALPGGTRVQADTSTPPAPVADLPTDSSIAAA
jgi:enamine deaminase RidA (YjgF/YER057c/UK114 family)